MIPVFEVNQTFLYPRQIKDLTDDEVKSETQNLGWDSSLPVCVLRAQLQKEAMRIVKSKYGK